MIHDTWHMTHDTWYMIHDTWYMMIHNTWHMIHDTWHMTHDTWYMIHDTWYMIHDDTWYMIYVIWYMSHDTWYMIHDTWYMILAGQIRGQMSVCRAWNALPNNVEHKVEAIMEPFRSRMAASLKDPGSIPGVYPQAPHTKKETITVGYRTLAPPDISPH